MSQRDREKYEDLEGLYSSENRKAVNTFLEGHKTKVIDIEKLLLKQHIEISRPKIINFSPIKTLHSFILVA